jgi:hypothetical protein
MSVRFCVTERTTVGAVTRERRSAGLLTPGSPASDLYSLGWRSVVVWGSSPAPTQTRGLRQDRDEVTAATSLLIGLDPFNRHRDRFAAANAQ